MQSKKDMQPIFTPLTREEAAAACANDFAAVLTRQRVRKQLSIPAVARRLQVSSEEYRSWERGAGFPTASGCRRLASVLWNNQRRRIEQLCRRGRCQRRTALTARMLHKNKITLSALSSFHRSNKTWLSCVKDALADNAAQLSAPAAAKLADLLTANKKPSLAALRKITAILQLDFDNLCNKVLIETILTTYRQLKTKHGDFLVAQPLRKAIEDAASVLDNRDTRSVSALLARVSTDTAVAALPLTFAARLRHAATSLSEAAATSTIDEFLLELYYYGLRLPASNAAVVKKICDAFDLTFSQSLLEALRIEEKARKYLQRMYQSKTAANSGLTRPVLRAAIETIMADYARLSRKVFQRRVGAQLSMRKAAQLLRLDVDDYLELEWCMQPTKLFLLRDKRFRKRLARFLNTTTETLTKLTSAATARREAQQRDARNAKPAREAQLAAEAAAEQEARVFDDTPQLAAQKILCRLAEQQITAATLTDYNKTFVTYLKESGVCTPAAAAKGGIDAAKIRFYYHGRGFPNRSDLQKICLGFEIEDGEAMQRLIDIERVVMEYQLDVARLGVLPLPPAIAAALAQAAAVKMRDYSIFSRTLFKRRAELQLSPLEAARRLGCKDSTDYRKLEWSITPSLSRALKKPAMLAAVADFLQMSLASLRALIAQGTDRQATRPGREDTPASAAWNINQRLRKHALVVEDFETFDKTFAAHIREAEVSVAEASALCGLDNTRLRQYVDGKGFPVDCESLKKVCTAFTLDYEKMKELVSVEKTVRRYMSDTSRLGALPLAARLHNALAKAVETVVAEYSPFALRLYRRRCELQITQREAAARLGMDGANNYRKLEQSTAPLLDRSFKKNSQILENIAKFLQMPADELKQLFVEEHARQTQSGTYALKLAAERMLEALTQHGLDVAALNSFQQSFSARLRASGVSLAEACRRSVFTRSKIKPCFDGQHLPVDKYELRQFCSDFSLGDYEMVKQQLDIEKVVRDYMAKITRYGALALPDDVSTALERAVEIIMSDYSALSRRLIQRRTELQLSMENVAATLGIKTHEYYRKMERSIGALPAGALRGNPETIPRMAEFLQISIEELRELIAQAGDDDDSEPPPTNEDSAANLLKQATTEIIRRLREKNITPECLKSFAKTFAAHLRETGIDPQTAAARVDMEMAELEPYLRGERMPHGEHELQKICTAFGINHQAGLQKVIDIEEVANFYMLKISEMGALPFPEETKDALNRVAQLIKSTYSEFGKLLFRKRFELKMSLEEAAQELGIEQPQRYHELERSAVPSCSPVLRSNPAIVENLAEFLELPLASVQKLVSERSASVQ